MASGKTIQEIEQSKSDSIMNTIAWRAAYYRNNPQVYCEEVLKIHLKWFQKILLWAMFHYDYFMFIASRGLGKTFLTALSLSIQCILFPGTKVVVCSGVLKQANEVLLKIKDELMVMSPMLRYEIKECHVGQNDSTILFKNGSWLKTRTSTDNARSARATAIFVDEFRTIDKTILDTVIRKFLADPRHPGYLNKPEYEHLQERNREYYASSAWYQDHWSYKKLQSYVLSFFNDKRRYFCCGLPYQLAIREHLLMRSQVEDEMAEADFSQTAWDIEMSCMWFGDSEGSFFKLDDFNNMRKVSNVLFPLDFYNESYKVPDVSKDGERIMSLDIALMASNTKKKNDASSIHIADLDKISPTSYKRNIIYSENFEGIKSQDLAIIFARYFHRYKCTYACLDCQGVGLPIYDLLTEPIYDPETGETYPPMVCINDSDMADRCKYKDALKVIYSVKANNKTNTQMCIGLRDAIKNGKINFPKNEMFVDDYLIKEYKPFKNLSLTDQVKIKTAYINTTLLSYELIKLQTIVSGNDLKVKEESGMRKDRYSSVSYLNWLAGELEQGLRPKNTNTQSLINKLVIHRGSFNGMTI